MEIGRVMERMMSLDDATWARHSNPWSGWTRVTVLPLFALAVWSRVWLGWYALVPVALVVFWTWINPRLFRAPENNAAWMTRGVLGERIWLARGRTAIPTGHAAAAMYLNTVAAVGSVMMLAGLWWLNLALTLTGMVAAMGAKLWFLDRMVWLHRDTTQG